jgi:hypothetical protein
MLGIFFEREMVIDLGARHAMPLQIPAGYCVSVISKAAPM